jgi:phosphodiesterase/alkaline phosphatase D-like protein
MLFRRLAPVVVVAAVVAALPSAAGAARFKQGVTAADVSQRSAILWTRAPRAGRVNLIVGRESRGLKIADKMRTRAPAANDRTVRVKLGNLRPGRRYFYRFQQRGTRGPVGRFVTAPAPADRRSFSFAFSGDADAQHAPYDTEPFYNDFEAYGSMAREGNAFNINLGDTIYSDSEVGATVENGEGVPLFPLARTVPQKWAKYRRNLGLRNLRRVRAQTSMFNVWDDHEFVNDFTLAEDGAEIFEAGAKAFGDYMPVTRRAATGIYRSVRWGANAELFFLDERSFRSAKATATDVCDNTESGIVDLAPTAPQYIRDRFALIYPPLGEPISQACLDVIRDPARTMLGATQLERFTNAVRGSRARWKIVVNQVPIQQLYVFPYDRWEGYEAERQTVLRTLSEVDNTVVLTTDAHANFFNDARFQTLEPGGPQDSGVPEMVTGPVATMTEEKEYDAVIGEPGTTDVLRTIFYQPSPPDGVGMICSVTDAYSYTQVEVARNRLTLRPKDLNGKPLREEGDPGEPCGPFRIKAE